MGIIGAAVISNWALGLVRAAGAVLLDIRPHAELVRSVRENLEAAPTALPTCTSGGWAGTQRGHRDDRLTRTASAEFLQSTPGKSPRSQPRNDRGRTVRLGSDFK